MERRREAFTNHILSRAVVGQPTQKVGMGATILAWTERYPTSLLGENKIEAIKEYRALTGASLVDSKNEVERVYNQIKREWKQ